MRKLLAIGAACALTIGLSAQAVSTVHPAGFKKTEGNYSGYYYYYGAWWYTNSSTTYRQFHMQYVTETASTVKGAMDSVTFRRDSSANPGTMSPAYWTEIEVSVSNAPTKSNTISRTFASNVGTNATIVIAKKKINVASKPYVGSLPEPFLIRFAFDKKFVYLATKGSLCFDVKHYNNNLYNTTTRTYTYMYIDCFGQYTSSTSYNYGAYLEGPSERCFNSNPWARYPMRHYAYNYVRSNQLNMYWYGYELELNAPFVVLVATQKLPAGIPLSCGKFWLNPGMIVVSSAGITDGRGYGRFPKSGNLTMTFDAKTMANISLFSQILSISKKAELKVTNWYMRTTPPLPVSGYLPGGICYRNGSTAFTSTTGYTYTTFQRGPVLQLGGVQ